MPEYLAPGVFVEEVPFRAKSIEGVSTTTTGFVGPTRFGPTDLEPDVITSLVEFERVHGDGQPLDFGDEGTLPNYMWHAARAFFTEGGKRLYVSRVFLRNDEADPASGRATGRFGGDQANPSAADDAPLETRFPDSLLVRARFPGRAGNLRVRITLRLGPNVLTTEMIRGVRRNRVAGLSEFDVVWVSDQGSPPSSPRTGALHVATSRTDDTGRRLWTFTSPASSPPGSPNGQTIDFDRLVASSDPSATDEVRVATATVTVLGPGADDAPQVWNELPLDPRHRSAGAPDSITDVFAEHPSNLGRARTLPLVITVGENVDSGAGVWRALFDHSPGLAAQLDDPRSTDNERSAVITLEGGNDGRRPGADDYKGEAEPDSLTATGLAALEGVEDISIVAAPGSTAGFESGDARRSDAMAVIQFLVAHAQNMRYRIAVLDSGDGQTIADVRNMRGKIDSKYAAFYYPWVTVLDPITRAEIDLPPSGFVAGIYARNDIERAVFKAPANEVVNLAIGFERLLNKAQQEVLNPDGVNCFRFFEGRGYRLWGARTATSDPEWKYVNLRRYFNYLEHSIDRGTQWAVFEPNGERLWANVRRTVEDFLFNEFQMGALLGDKPERAYFVKCDRSTMTQNDLDNGRLVCLIGVAPLRPAEFVIFRIGQMTADART